MNRDPDFYRMSGWPMNMEVDQDMTWRDALKAGSFCIATIADLQAESFACLPAKEEQTLRRGNVAVALVPAPEPVSVPSPRPWSPQREWLRDTIIFLAILAGVVALIERCAK